MEPLKTRPVESADGHIRGQLTPLHFYVGIQCKLCWHDRVVQSGLSEGSTAPLHQGDEAGVRLFCAVTPPEYLTRLISAF